MNEKYVLRARVIEGSIPMPKVTGERYQGLSENNFEIFAPYTRDNLKTLYAIGKDAWRNDTLSKFEILGWAGGVNNHDGDRFLWVFRPDLWNFELAPLTILKHFDDYKPKSLPDDMKQIYDHFWKKMKFGFSLNSYLFYTKGKETLSLADQLHIADQQIEQKAA